MSGQFWWVQGHIDVPFSAALYSLKVVRRAQDALSCDVSTKRVSQDEQRPVLKDLHIHTQYKYN